MKFGNDIGSRIGRGLILAGGILLAFGLVSCIYDGNFLGVLVCIVLLSFLVYAKYEDSVGELTEDGVTVRHFFRKRFYPWSKIQQVGVLARSARQTYYEIILVKPGASIREGAGDSSFLRRNRFRLIHIPYHPGTLCYITSCCDRLDFDERGVW